MYLRDARHVDKFMYTLGSALFYEPYEAHYKPSEDYMSSVRNLLEKSSSNWLVSREGLWCHVHPAKAILPAQGWKVHVSATIRNGPAILEKAAKVALEQSVPFKFAADRNILSLFCSKRWDRGGSGKFLTLYPSDLPSFTLLLEALYAVLRLEDGPYILSDRRYRDCRVLYYRYGGIQPISQLDVKGERVPVLFSPEGVATPDVRTPYFLPPKWAQDPFPATEATGNELTLHDGRYQVLRALSFSNSGGVYLARDRENGTEVVIKEARAHTLVDDRGHDSIALLRKELEMLRILESTGISPRPIDSFHEWENFFLVEEYLTGLDFRDIMLSQSPLLLVNPTVEDSKGFYETFLKTCRSFLEAVKTLHEHGIVFGDLSANNIKVDPFTSEVRILDFEAAFRPGIEEATYAYTPGFKDPLSIKKTTPGYEDDLYGIAAIMFYMIFPIHALASSREDLYDTVLKTIVEDLGWAETPVFPVIRGLAKAQLQCSAAEQLLNEPALIAAPSYQGPFASETAPNMVADLGSFLLAHMHSENDGWLFDSDPFMHQTNRLSLGFGACGTLVALKKCGLEIPQSGFAWLNKELASVKPGSLPPGIFTGAAGIAVSLLELGLPDRAAEMMTVANASPLLHHHHSYLYGTAGVGMANLHLFAATQELKYLQTAVELGESLLKKAEESGQGLFWRSDGVVHLGFGYGQSGVALFLLRLSQFTGTDRYRSEGKRALVYDLSHAIEVEDGVLSFPRGPGDATVDPYIEEGSAGVARVAMRYGLWDQLDKILADVQRKYARYAGLFYGLASFIDVLTDAFLFSGDSKYLQKAKLPISGIRDLYLIKQAQGAATPGDGLLRISCDYATGVAGVMRAMHRYDQLDAGDFMLDQEVAALNEPDSFQNFRAHAGSRPDQMAAR